MAYKRYGSRRRPVRKVTRRSIYRKKPRYAKRYGQNKVKSAFIPAAFYTKLRYTERRLLTSTAGAVVGNLYRGNSPYDPNFSFGGISALGFSSFAPLYFKYRVFASKFTVRAVLESTTSTNGGSYELAILPTNDGFPGNPTPEEVSMNPRGKFAISGNKNSTTRVNMKSYCTTSSIQGMKRIGIKIRDENAAAVNTNPADQWYWNILMQPTDHASDTSVAIYVSITYYVKFEDRRPFTS